MPRLDDALTMTGTPHVAPLALRSGPSHWLDSYGLMFRWELLSLRMILPLMLVIQLFMGAGVVVGFGLLFERVPRTQALFLSTGSTVIALLMVGLVMAPQMVAQQRMRGTYDFLWSLPVPRLAQVAASLTVWMLIALPGMVLALLAAAWRYDLALAPSWQVIPAALLTVLVATSVGYGFAHAVSNPMVTALITQVLAFVILIYSPINFPVERLPGWLAGLHHALPFEHAATVMRAALTGIDPGGLALSYAVLAAWAIGGWIVTWRVVGRRK